jgi:formylmethanofuran dehydrogenase subunit A
MKIKIEFTRTRSPNFARVLSLARREQSFQKFESEGITIYSIEFNDEELDTAQAFMDYVHMWKGTAYFRDGRLVSKHAGYRLVWYNMRSQTREFYTEDVRRQRLNRIAAFRKKIRDANTAQDIVEPEDDDKPV